MWVTFHPRFGYPLRSAAVFIGPSPPKSSPEAAPVVTPRSPYVSPSRKPFPPLDSPPTSPFKGTAAPAGAAPFISLGVGELLDLETGGLAVGEEARQGRPPPSWASVHSTPGISIASPAGVVWCTFGMLCRVAQKKMVSIGSGGPPPHIPFFHGAPILRINFDFVLPTPSTPSPPPSWWGRVNLFPHQASHSPAHPGGGWGSHSAHFPFSRGTAFRSKFSFTSATLCVPPW